MCVGSRGRFETPHQDESTAAAAAGLRAIIAVLSAVSIVLLHFIGVFVFFSAHIGVEGAPLPRTCFSFTRPRRKTLIGCSTTLKASGFDRFAIRV
jgi:hypothetical protein